MIGAGFMARGVALQVATASPGIRIVAIANRTLQKAFQAYEEAGEDSVAACKTQAEMDAALKDGRAAVTTDPMLLAKAKGIDVLFEVTGAVEDALPAILAGIATRQARRADECRARRDASARS